MARVDGSEIRFYESPEISKVKPFYDKGHFYSFCHFVNVLGRFAHKLVIPKVGKYSLSCGPEPYHVACYVPEVKVPNDFEYIDGE